MLQKLMAKAMMIAVAVAAMATAASAVVVALAFALYALLRAPLGPALAAACVAGAFALAIAMVGAILAVAVSPKGRARAEERESLKLAESVVEMLQERPIVAALGMAAAAGFALVRKPATIALVVQKFMGARGKDRRGRPAKGGRGKA